jgi:hypothetical protein
MNEKWRRTGRFLLLLVGRALSQRLKHSVIGVILQHPVAPTANVPIRSQPGLMRSVCLRLRGAANLRLTDVRRSPNVRGLEETDDKQSRDRNHCLQLACRAARRWTCETRLTATTVQVSTAAASGFARPLMPLMAGGSNAICWSLEFPISPFRAIQHPGAIRPTIGSLNLTPRSRASPPER